MARSAATGPTASASTVLGATATPGAPASRPARPRPAPHAALPGGPTFGTAAARLSHGASPEAIRRAARDFEAQALGQMLQPMFATLDTSRSAFGGGAGETQWRPMLVEAYAAAATRAGGIGLAAAVQREMQRAQAIAAAGTPDALSGAAADDGGRR